MHPACQLHLIYIQLKRVEVRTNQMLAKMVSSLNQLESEIYQNKQANQIRRR